MATKYTLTAHKGDLYEESISYMNVRYGWCKKKEKRLRKKGYSFTMIIITTWGRYEL